MSEEIKTVNDWRLNKLYVIRKNIVSKLAKSEDFILSRGNGCGMNSLNTYMWIDGIYIPNKTMFRLFLQTFNNEHLISNIDKISVLKITLTDETFSDNKKNVNDKNKLHTNRFILLDGHIENIKNEENFKELNISAYDEKDNIFNEFKNYIDGSKNNSKVNCVEDSYMVNKIIEEKAKIKEALKTKISNCTVTTYNDKFLLNVSINNRNYKIYLCSYDLDEETKNKHIIQGRVTIIEENEQNNYLYNKYTGCTKLQKEAINITDEDYIDKIIAKLNELSADDGKNGQ